MAGALLFFAGDASARAHVAGFVVNFAKTACCAPPHLRN